MDAGDRRGQVETGNMPLKLLLERYLTEVTPTKRSGATEAIRIKAMMRWKLAGFSLVNLSPERVAECRDDRLRRVGASTVIRDLALLSGVINHARREWGLGVANPCALVRRPPAPIGRDRILSADEEQQLLATLNKGKRLNRYMPFVVMLAVETAMRRSELLSVQWTDVKIHERTIRLNLTKNGSARDVPLSTRAIAVLEAVPREGSPEVFPITWWALEAAFSRACVRAGIGNLRFHDLRHTGASRMASKLPNLIELSAVTGHKTMQMLKRYYHPKASDLALKLG
jgi:integrase